MLQCPACGNFDCFTTEGVDPRLVARGYMKCTVCGRTVKPAIVPNPSAVAPAQEVAAPESA